MDKGAKLVAESILGVDFRTILINNKAYTVYPPTIKIICRGIREWSTLDFSIEGQTKATVISQINGNEKSILKGLSYFVTGDVKNYRLRAWLLYLKWRYGTPSILPEEMKKAVTAVFELIQAEDFFDCAALCRSVTGMAAKPA